MISLNANIRIEPSARSFLAGSCHTVTVNGTSWGGTAITPYSMNDYTIDASTVQQLVPSWAYGGAYVKKVYSEVSPKNTSTTDNKCLILYVANDQSSAQWVFSILKRGSAASGANNAWSYLDLFLTPIHYTNGIFRALADNIAPVGTWLSMIPPANDAHAITEEQANMYLNGCIKDLSSWLAPGDGAYGSVSIT